MKRMTTGLLMLILLLVMCAGQMTTAAAAGEPDHWHRWEKRGETEPTCTKPGTIINMCTICGETETIETEPALGHNWGKWKTAKKATCDKAGAKERTCKRCGKKETGSVPATGKHSFVWKTTKEPTCAEKGKKEQVCIVCGAKGKAQSIAATGKHKFGKWKVTKEAECTKEGKKARTCKVCGYKETGKIPATGHDWDEGVITKEPYVYDLASYTDGEILYTCKNNVSHTKTKLIKPAPSLHLAMERASDQLYHQVISDSSYNDYVYTNDTVTNTGNVPINAAYWNGVDNYGIYSAFLQPGESYTFKNVEHRVAHYSKEPYENHWDTISYTPEDPDHIGYVTVTAWYEGLSPYSNFDDILSHVCDSNTCSVTVYIGKNTENLPTLFLAKDVANPPADGGIFNAGEQIDWSLTAANTTKDPVTDVTVTDLGVNVGSFSEIGPGETQSCSVPSHTVTEYETIMGYVSNYAAAAGTDAKGETHSWPSNVATAYTSKLGEEDDPLGPIFGLDVAARLIKEETHGPANGEYYELNEQIDYIITIINTGGTTLNNLTVTDSLAGLVPIDSAESLAPGEEKSFTYSHTVTQEELKQHWAVNSAVITYTFGDGIPGTPRFTNRVYSRAGEGEWPVPAGSFDSGKLRENGGCSLTLDTLGSAGAEYTLRTCADHLEALRAAEAEPEKTAEIWLAEIEKLYGTLYEAADDAAKCALIEEYAMSRAYLKACAEAVLKDGAAAGALRMECARLCEAVHTAPDLPAGSVTGEHGTREGSVYETGSREIGKQDGNACGVTERYDARCAAALSDTLAMLEYDRFPGEAFLSGRKFWQIAVDGIVQPIYNAADEAQRKLIAVWRVLLDRRAQTELGLYVVLYRGNSPAAAEAQMNLYRDAALNAVSMKP